MIEQGYFQVDWDANKLAVEASTVSRWQWMTKFELNMCVLEIMMKI